MRDGRTPGLQVLGSLLLLLLARPEPGGAQEARIFQPPDTWLHPEKAFLRERDLLFQDPYTQNFGSGTFSFAGRLDDGTFFNFTVFQWRYTIWSGWGLFVLIVEPDGSRFVLEERIPDKTVSLSPDRLLLRFGDSSITGSDGEYRIRLNVPGLACDIAVHNLLPPWQPGDGYAWLTSKRDVYMRYGVHSPWAVTSGTLVLRGRTHSGRGQCFGDRSRASYPLSRMYPSLIAIRGFSAAQVPPADRWFLGTVFLRTHESYGSLPVAHLILAHGGRWVFTTRNFTLAPADLRQEERSRLPWPRTFRLTAEENGYLLRGEFTSTELVHLTDILRRLPAMFQPIAAVFLKTPVIFRSVGFFRGALTLPDGAIQAIELPAQCEYNILR